MMHMVLQRDGAVKMVEAAIRSIANNGSIGLTSGSLVDAEAIATVAADWVSQLFGVIWLYHLGQACDAHEAVQCINDHGGSMFASHHMHNLSHFDMLLFAFANTPHS